MVVMSSLRRTTNPTTDIKKADAEGNASELPDTHLILETEPLKESAVYDCKNKLDT